VRCKPLSFSPDTESQCVYNLLVNHSYSFHCVTRWSAQLPEETLGKMIDLASWKLQNGDELRTTDKDHIFAVISQHLCLDPVIAASDAIQFAVHSVAHHMRLLTGVSTSSERFYTHSPSEPMLVMGSIDILHNRLYPDCLWCQSLSHCYFCARFIQNSKKIPDLFPLGKMLSLVGWKDPQEELNLDSILREFFSPAIPKFAHG
jgi:hypothetical protein